MYVKCRACCTDKKDSEVIYEMCNEPYYEEESVVIENQSKIEGSKPDEYYYDEEDDSDSYS